MEEEIDACTQDNESVVVLENSCTVGNQLAIILFHIHLAVEKKTVSNDSWS